SSLEERRSVAGCRIEEVLRLEPLIERLIGEAESMDDFLDAYGAALGDLRGRGIVGLKSVIAYRSGLHVAPTLRADAADGYRLTRATWLAEGRVRIESKPLLDYLIVIAVEAAARQKRPSTLVSARRRCGGRAPPERADPVPHRPGRPGPRPHACRPGRAALPVQRTV